MNREESIHIRGWSKSYRRKQALQPLELRLREGVTLEGIGHHPDDRVIELDHGRIVSIRSCNQE